MPIPSVPKLFLKTPLYEPTQLEDADTAIMWTIIAGDLQFDGFYCECGANTIFKASSQIQQHQQGL
jgi:hypothetical protein